MEEDWVSLLTVNCWEKYPRLKRFIEMGADASRSLLNLKMDIRQGFDPTEAYCDFRNKIISLLYLLASIVESHGEVLREGGGKAALRHDLSNLVEYLNGPEAERALNEAREGRIGSLLSQITLMESLLDSYFFDLIRTGYEEAIKRLPKKVVDEALKKGGLVPKFTELRKEKIGGERVV